MKLDTLALSIKKVGCKSMFKYNVNRSSIYLQVMINGRPHRFFTKYRTNKDRSNWNQARGVFKGEGEAVAAINQYLTEFKTAVEVFMVDAKRNNIYITEQDLQEHLDKLFSTGVKRKQERKDNSLLNYMQLQIDSQNKKHGTIKTYICTRNNVKAYLKKLGRSDIQFPNMDAAFWKHYSNYLSGLGTIATKDKHIKILKSFMGFAIKDQKDVNMAYLDVKRESRKVLANDTFAIYLNEQEIKNISNLELEGQDRLIADILCFACYTALRYSDLMELSEENFKTEGKVVWLSYRQVKTSDRVFAPILYKEAIEIMQRNNWSFPKLADGTINKRIKEILKENDLFTENVKVTGTRKKGIHPKYSLVSLHTGRRSYCTNSYNRGIPYDKILIASGHSTIAELLKYILTTKEEAARGLLDYVNY